MSWYTGEDNSIKLVFTDSAGDAIDITGYKVEFALKKSVNDTDAQAIVFKTVTSHTDAANGITHIDLTDAIDDIDPGVYVETIQRFDASDKLQVVRQMKRTITKKGIGNNE